jgi:hypothetical protein
MVIASIAPPHTVMAVDTLEPVNLIKASSRTGNWVFRTANREQQYQSIYA